MATLHTFLEGVRVIRNAKRNATDEQQAKEAATHTSMSGGSYYIPAYQYDHFMDLYAAALTQAQSQAHPPLSLVERHRHIGPVVVDIDLRHRGVARLYDTCAHVKPFLAHLCAQLAKLVVLPPGTDVCVLEKPAPRPAAKAKRGSSSSSSSANDDNENIHKDGIHVILPEVYTHPALQRRLREAMLQHVAETFGAIVGVTNAPGNIYDEAVIERNGWFMYGSKKPDEPAPWRLTSVWRCNAASTGRGDDVTMVWDDDDKTADDGCYDASPATLAKRFSIRRIAMSEADMTPLGEDVLQQALDAQRQLRQQRSRSNDDTNTDTNMDTNMDTTGNIDALADLVAMLAPERAIGYHDWWAVASALHHATTVDAALVIGSRRESGNLGLELFHRFSALCSDKYDAYEVDALWRNLDRRSQDPRHDQRRLTTVGSLLKWAKKDAGPTAFAAWEQKHAGTLMVKSRPSTMASGRKQQQRSDNVNRGSTINALVMQEGAGGDQQHAAADIKRSFARLLNAHGLPSHLPRISGASLQVVIVVVDDSGKMRRRINFVDPAVGVSGSFDYPDEKTHNCGRSLRIDQPVPEFIGLLVDKKVMLHERLTFIHPSINYAAACFEVTHPAECLLVVTSVTPNAPVEINVHNANNDKEAWCLIRCASGTKDVVLKAGRPDTIRQVRAIRAMIFRAVAEADTMLFANNGIVNMLTINGAITINNIRNNNKETGGEKDEDGRNTFEQLRDIVFENAKAQRLRKLGGYVWTPVDNCPCAYRQGPEYVEHLNDVLNNVRTYHSRVKFQSELVQYMTSFNPPELADIVFDRYLLSFTDGVLDLTSDGPEHAPNPCFYKYGSPEADAMVEAGRVARHHIDLCFDDSQPGHTPLFDAMLSAQFSPPVVEALHALLGRLFFPIKKYDNWQVMPWLVGITGTGKSTLLSVLDAMFARHTVSALCGTQEQTFGLDGKYKSHLLVGRDLPHEMSKVLSQEMLQSMVSGEMVSVARKNKLAVELDWDVPMIFASNHMPDYTDNGGQIARRLVVFLYRNIIRERDGTLCDRIKAQELPAIIYKVVTAYASAVKEHAGRDFWSWCPRELLDARDEVATSTSFVRRFLAVAKEDPEAVYESSGELVWVSKAPEICTSLSALKKAFAAFMKTHHRGVKTVEKIDKDSMHLAGFDVSTRKVCSACHRLVPSKASGGAKCCSAFARNARVDLIAVVGVSLEREFIVHETADGLD